MLDPNDFVDVNEATGGKKIERATFTIIPGTNRNAALRFRAGGIGFLGAQTSHNWAISLYSGNKYNGQDLPISDEAARHVLEKLARSRDIEDFEWAEYESNNFE